MSRTRQINFRCPEDIADLFESTAKDVRMSLTTWLIIVGLEAAGHGELRHQLERVAKAPRKRATKKAVRKKR